MVTSPMNLHQTLHKFTCQGGGWGGKGGLEGWNPSLGGAGGSLVRTDCAWVNHLKAMGSSSHPNSHRGKTQVTVLVLFGFQVDPSEGLGNWLIVRRRLNEGASASGDLTIRDDHQMDKTIDG